MSSSPTNRFLIAFVFTLLTAAVMVGAAGPAYAADDCIPAGGRCPFLPGECRIDAVKMTSDAAHGGPFTLNGSCWPVAGDPEASSCRPRPGSVPSP